MSGAFPLHRSPCGEGPFFAHPGPARRRARSPLSLDSRSVPRFYSIHAAAGRLVVPSPLRSRSRFRIRSLRCVGARLPVLSYISRACLRHVLVGMAHASAGLDGHASFPVSGDEARIPRCVPEVCVEVERGGGCCSQHDCGAWG